MKLVKSGAEFLGWLLQKPEHFTVTLSCFERLKLRQQWNRLNSWWSLSHVQLFVAPWTVPTRLLCPWGFFRQEYWSGLPCLPPGDPPNPGIEPRFPALQVDSLPTESAGKPKNTGVGKLSFLQGIFPTQQLEWGLLHCRRILYQLSYQGSPWTQPRGKVSIS